MTISHLGFLTAGNYPAHDPLAGLEQSLRLFSRGDALGYDSAWVRQRHLERSVSSAATFLAAATQRTVRIALGAAVIQMGYENPFRLAEDLGTVDALSRGRLHVGLSAGAPGYASLLGDRLLDADAARIDFSHARLLRLRENLAGAYFGDADTVIESPAGRERPRVNPHVPGLAGRLWYGGGSLRSAEWAARNGFHLLIGNVCRGEASDDFHAAQAAQLDLFLSTWAEASPPRVALGRVIVPLDSAEAVSRQRYRDFAAARVARTLAPQGDSRTLFAPDLVGMCDEIVERLLADPVLARVTELRLELPYDLAFDEYEQILTDVASRIAPALGWMPAGLVAAANGAGAAVH
ncbi:LLM class flavin-dependent oxidoreductase [Burkholderia singularis]|nr:LLM class flavin-dependent oxidoreductase [Burkholderia singularis]